MKLSHNQKIQDLVRETSERLGETVADSHGFPIPLVQLATQRNINDLSFQPIIPDAVLLGGNGNFRIVFSSLGDHDHSEIKRQLESDGGKHLPGRWRFTIAHEIAHTFLYEFKDSGEPIKVHKLKKQRKTETREEQSALTIEETLCNDAAARMLMPYNELYRQSQDGSPYENPETFLRYTKHFGVSIEALASRLDNRSVKSQMPFYGAIFVLLHIKKRKWKVSKKILGSGSVPVEMSLLNPGSFWPTEIGGTEFILNGGDEHRIITELAVRYDLKERFRIQVAQGPKDCAVVCVNVSKS